MNEKEIISKYPELFGEEINNPKESLMCFGLETPITWYPCLDKLFEKISKIVLKNNLINFRIIQVKEKFGELRIYTKFSTEEIEKLIDETEEELSKICSICGNENGEIKIIKGWIMSICDKCENDKK